MRKTYVYSDDQHPVSEEGDHCSCEHAEKTEAPKVTELLLFTSPTCPNCKTAKLLLDREGIAYKALDAATNRELTEAYGIKKAPTLLVPEGDSFHAYDNASLIKGYIEASKKR